MFLPDATLLPNPAHGFIFIDEYNEVDIEWSAKESRFTVLCGSGKEQTINSRVMEGDEAVRLLACWLSNTAFGFKCILAQY